MIDHGPLKLSNILRLREEMEIVTLKYCSSTAPYMDMCKLSKQINRKKTRHITTASKGPQDKTRRLTVPQAGSRCNESVSSESEVLSRCHITVTPKQLTLSLRTSVPVFQGISESRQVNCAVHCEGKVSCEPARVSGVQ